MHNQEECKEMCIKKVPFVSGPLFHDNLAENLSYITILLES